MDEQVRGTTPGNGQPVLRSFLEATDDRVLPTTVSKPALTELCHALEDLVVDDDLPGTVIAGFQRSRFWAIERERYAALVADPRRRAVVFTADEGEDVPGVQRLIVGPDHPVAREWFLITLTSAFSAVLFGRELSRSDVSEQAGRQFVTVWSCERSVVDDLLTVLGEALGDSVPGATAALAAARAAHPPREPAAGMTQRFATAFFERLEAATQRTRSLEAELDGAKRLLARLEVNRRLGEPEPPSGAEQEPVPEPRPGPGPTQANTVGQEGPEAHVVGADPQPDAHLPAHDPATAPDEVTPEPLGVHPTTRHALVLHGDPALRGLLEALLRRSGWEVTAADSVDRALDAVTMTTFDAILVDARLVDGGGAAFLDELERVQPDARARTAFVTDEATLAAGHHGHPVVATPLVWRDLEAVLETLTAAL